ncbi:ferredoxin-thioredoxin reductase catalytic domain-containing protein [Gemmatimonadota bacterium]
MSDEHSDAARDLREKLKSEAEAAGYFLNPDIDFVLDLMEGLLKNEERHGYQACPCRLPDGTREQDLDIICPCDYRDPDVSEFGACYCALYVSEEIAGGEKEAEPVPERRGTPAAAGWGPTGSSEAHEDHEEEFVGFTASGIPVWRCTVCGYLCARPQPPMKCPVCHVDRDRFERFA